MIRPRITTEPMPVQAQRMAEARAKLFRATPLHDIREEPYEPCAADIAFRQARAEGRV